jgi:hypothetical protein
MMNCAPHPCDFGVYQPRKSGKGSYFRCIEIHFEDLEAVWDNLNA